MVEEIIGICSLARRASPCTSKKALLEAVKLNEQAQPKRFADVLKLVAKGRREINRQVYSAARSIVSPKYTREIRLPDETGINN